MTFTRGLAAGAMFAVIIALNVIGWFIIIALVGVSTLALAASGRNSVSGAYVEARTAEVQRKLEVPALVVPNPFWYVLCQPP